MNEIKFKALLNKINNNNLVELDITYEMITDIELQEGDSRYLKPEKLLIMENKERTIKVENEKKNNLKKIESEKPKFKINEESLKNFAKAKEKSDKIKKEYEQLKRVESWVEVPDSQSKRLFMAISQNNSLKRIIMPGKSVRLNEKYVDLFGKFFYNVHLLERLDLNSQKLSNKILENILNNILNSEVELIELNLYKNNLISGTTVFECARVNKIKYLNLGSNFLGDEGIFSFEPYDIYKLNLTYNNITFESNDVIKRMFSGNISSLDLSWNKLDDSSAFVIAEALLKNDSINRLDLRNNKISKKGLRAILTVAVQHPSLSKVYLDGNLLSDDEMQNLKEQVIFDYMIAKNSYHQYSKHKEFLNSMLSKINERKNFYNDLHVNAKEVLKVAWNEILEGLYNDVKVKGEVIKKVEDRINNLENIILKKEMLPFYKLMKSPIKLKELKEDIQFIKKKTKL